MYPAKRKSVAEAGAVVNPKENKNPRTNALIIPKLPRVSTVE
jgi:hypothetical protein